MALIARSAPIQNMWSGVLFGAVAVGAVSGAIVLLDPRIPAPYLLVLYVLVVIAAAVLWGTTAGVCVAVVSTLVVDYLFIHPPFNVDDPSGVFGSVAFLVTAVVVGRLTGRLRMAVLELESLYEQQFALRRIATLVARSAPPVEVFAAVTREVGLLCRADLARMERYEQDGSVTGIAAWSRVPAACLSVGTRFDLVGPSIASAVHECRKPVRVNSLTTFRVKSHAKHAQSEFVRRSAAQSSWPDSYGA
jgi:K+-sensing histidine kinase KdpD